LISRKGAKLAKVAKAYLFPAVGCGLGVKYFQNETINMNRKNSNWDTAISWSATLRDIRRTKYFCWFATNC